MTILSSQITKTINKQGGRRAIYEEHIDDLGKIHEHRYYCHAAWDEIQALSDYAAGLETSLKNAELIQISEFIREGGDPAEIVRVRVTPAEAAQAAVRGAMMQKDPLVIMPFAEYVNVNISNGQLNSWFGAAKATKIRNRVNALIANKAFLEADIASVDEDI